MLKPLRLTADFLYSSIPYSTVVDVIRVNMTVKHELFMTAATAADKGGSVPTSVYTYASAGSRSLSFSLLSIYLCRIYTTQGGAL